MTAAAPACTIVSPCDTQGRLYWLQVRGFNALSNWGISFRCALSQCPGACWQAVPAGTPADFVTTAS